MTHQFVPTHALLGTPPHTLMTNIMSVGKSAYGVAKTVAGIQKEIMTNGPVEAGYTVYEDFYQYTSGVYVHTAGKQLGGHAVKILGWGVDNNTPYWLVANSWNTDWGENAITRSGYFRIVRGLNECGIEHSIVAGLPNLILKNIARSGYFRIVRGLNECGIEHSIVAGLPK
ncbi:unnamed protein product [Strongylus vulgaris]|uniref:Peptidase C1A papain C-terminal domain-containing protein n=1 Tax=Strongylus vulgaris TaxID=40348 RepID=A0A3P7JI36_STRVU|nr:unnamed protein product [Strongylus vulgaris]